MAGRTIPFSALVKENNLTQLSQDEVVSVCLHECDVSFRVLKHNLNANVYVLWKNTLSLQHKGDARIWAFYAEMMHAFGFFTRK